MDEIKIWSVSDDEKVEPLKIRDQVATESLLETILVKNPDLLMSGDLDLTLVGRQMPTKEGWLDLLGVDGDGRLVVFELKRGRLSREAVAQIIEYASYLDGMASEELASHISATSGVDGIENFGQWYRTGFGETDSLKPLRLFLVGLGADDKTERMVRFLADNSDLDISLLTFHGFEHDGKIFLARQVEVDGAAEPGSRRSSRTLSRAEAEERLERYKEDFGVSDLFDDIHHTFTQDLPIAIGERHRQSIIFKSRAPKRRTLARIDAHPGIVRIVYHERAYRHCTSELDRVREVITPMTHKSPSGRGQEILIFPVDRQEWENHKDRLTALTRAVNEAWETRAKEDDSA